MEFRKHYSDFSTKEKDVLNKRIKEGTYKFTAHTVIRQKQRVVTMDEVFRALESHKIIEFHKVGDSNRVVIRGTADESGYNICLVLDINTKEMITVYCNSIKDNHEGLRRQEYIPAHISILGSLKN